MMRPLFDYTLHLADNCLIMGHRLSEWTGHGPMLEQDIAISNIALDLIGQSRNFYQYAASQKENASEDTLAYLRDTREFKNLLIAEKANGDWAQTITKLFFFSSYQYYLYRQMISSADRQLAAIAEKSLKEVTYHVRWSGDWAIRLGDGTDESTLRMQKAIDNIWPLTGEMFATASYERALLKDDISVDVSHLKNDWIKKVLAVFDEATLNMPGNDVWMQTGGKDGIHSEEMGYILSEMQFLQRAYPGCEW